MTTKQAKSKPKAKVLQVYLPLYTRDYPIMQETTSNHHVRCTCCNELIGSGHGWSHDIEKQTGKHKRHAAASSTI